MNEKRQQKRIQSADLHDDFKSVDLIIKGIRIEAEVEDISSFGIGVILQKLEFINKGEVFVIDLNNWQVQAICVHCDIADNGMISLGAYFLKPLKIISGRIVSG